MLPEPLVINAKLLLPDVRVPFSNVFDPWSERGGN